MSAIASWRWGTSLAAAAAAGAFAAFMAWVFAQPVIWDAPQRAMCDRQVAVLLSTRDAVDLMRAQYLIRRLRCDVWRRIPAQQ